MAVVAHPAARDLLAGWLATLPGDRVTVYLVVSSEEQATLAAEGNELGLGPALVETVTSRPALNRALARNGPADVILDLLPASALPTGTTSSFELFGHLFFHIVPRGVYVRDVSTDGVQHTEAGPELRQWQALEAAVQARDGDRARDRRLDHLARHVRRIAFDGSVIVARKRGRHYYKMREHQLGEFLATREPELSLDVLDSRPGGSFVHRAVVRSYGVGPDEEWSEQVEYPPTSVRRYRGDLVSCVGNQLLTGNTILPDSFRWHLARVLNQPHIESITPAFASVQKRAQSPARTLPGSYYYLDCAYSGHFGHLTTEVLSRLWGWDVAKQENPDLKALFHIRPKRDSGGRLERTLFTAYGIADSDLVAVRGAVRVEDVVAATPLWHNAEPYYAHPDIMETWARMTAGFLQGGPPAEHERIFISRGTDLAHRRGCHNQPEVERFFSEKGFHIVYPENLPMAEQVALFAGARVVAGFGGSAMFNLMHTRRLERLIVLSHDGYDARNEHLFASLLGGELHYFWSPADVRPPTKGARTEESFKSSWSFDFDRLRGDLERVVDAR